jgi:hypothetical protein
VSFLEKDVLVYILLLDIYFKLIFIIQYLLVLEWDLIRYFFGRVIVYRVSCSLKTPVFGGF